MTILVTGGAGYIGSHTVIKLLESSYAVIVADNFSNSKPDVIERIKYLSGRDFAFYNIDVCDNNQLNKIFQNHSIDCVIHFAALKAVAESVIKPLEYYYTNINSTISLCNAMRKHKVNKIIYSSSATVYSMSAEMPLTENSKTGDCLNPYGWTKYMCEQIITDITNSSDGWSAVLLRYFNPIGAHESGIIGDDPQGIPNNLMPYIAQTASGRFPHLNVFGNDYDTPDGTCIRDYIHVEDLASGHVAAIGYMYRSKGVNIFNLGTGNGVSVLELVNAFEEANNLKIKTVIAPRRPGDAPVSYAANDKAKKLLGWKPVKTIQQACSDTWKWQQYSSNIQ